MMRALTIVPQSPGSLSVQDMPAPEPAPAELLVDAMAVGVCGTDKEIVRGQQALPDGASVVVEAK